MTRWSLPALPDAQAVRYKKNLLQKVVCEARFPTIYGLDSKRPPPAFANALRKTYSDHSIAKNVNVGPGGGVSEEFAYIFRDKKSKSTVSMGASSIGVETSSYTTFEDFSARVISVFAAARSTIDAEFYTRVGLRYINVIPYQLDSVAKWVNPILVGALSSGMFGDVQECNGRMAAENEGGGFSFTHGIGMNADTREREYLLDLDFFAHDVETKEIEAVLRGLHDNEFKMFTWALGPSALEHMGPATPKERTGNVR